MEIRFFDPSIKEFIERLEMPGRAKAMRALVLLQEYGHLLKMPHSKKIVHRLFELRIHGQHEVRIIYTFHESEAWILLVFIKKTQKIPKQFIILAEQRLKALDHI